MNDSIVNVALVYHALFANSSSHASPRGVSTTRGEFDVLLFEEVNADFWRQESQVATLSRTWFSATSARSPSNLIVAGASEWRTNPQSASRNRSIHSMFMCGGGISRRGATRFCIFDGIMDADLYAMFLRRRSFHLLEINFPSTSSCRTVTRRIRPCECKLSSGDQFT